MNKMAIVLIALMMVSVCFLSGCNEQSMSNQIQILDHKIETKHGSYTATIKVSYGTQNKYVLDGDYKEVTVTIKNIANKNIDKVTITVRFYDNDNELLSTKTKTVSYIAKEETRNFSVVFGDVEPYYDQYDHYNISV